MTDTAATGICTARAVVPAVVPGEARIWAIWLWAAIFVGIPVLAVLLSVPLARPPARTAVDLSHALSTKAPSAPPSVEPLEIRKIAAVEAQAINAATPFSTDPNPAARAFHFSGDADAQSRAVDCLAAAQLYEAGDDASGQKAVAQVVINRMHHPAFPKTICGVVFQGSERVTGCQFTFTCDGALARIPPPSAWESARALATKMLTGAVDGRVGYATHYHTNWVIPYWSSSLDKITSIGSHLFFRWKGWWGTPRAFREVGGGGEPVIAKLAFLSPVHRAGSALAGLSPTPPGLPTFTDLARPAAAIGRDRIGERFGAGRLAAINSAGDAFVMLLDRNAKPDAFEQVARQMCSGRTKCRLLGWTRASDAPNNFPIDEETLATMSYAYMRATDVGLERSLYNCKEFHDQPTVRCMRERAPSVAVSPRTGTETVRLAP